MINIWYNIDIDKDKTDRLDKLKNLHPNGHVLLNVISRGKLNEIDCL
jgi:hypothetical protein